MLAQLALAPCSFNLAGTPARVADPRVASSPAMFGFLKELGLEKPDFLPDFGGSSAATTTVTVKEPNAGIVAGGKGMSLLGPVFSLEADLQAAAFNLGSYDEAEVQAEIQETIKSAPVVIYTYPLSPFSTEAISLLESTGCK